MSFPLQSLLDVRRRAEEEAADALAGALLRRERAVEAQRRLDECAAAARARATAAAYDGAPTTMARAWENERFRARLADEARAAAAAALTHRKGERAAAEAAADEARAQHAAARRDREAVEQREARQEQDRRRVADRRADDAAADLAGRRRS